MSFSSVSGKWIWLADSQSYSVLFQPRLLGTEIALFLTIKIPYFVQYIMNSINKKKNKNSLYCCFKLIFASD